MGGQARPLNPRSNSYIGTCLSLVTKAALGCFTEDGPGSTEPN